MHAQVTLDDSRFAKFSLKIIDTEMFDWSRKTALKTKVIGHLVHDFRENADVG